MHKQQQIPYFVLQILSLRFGKDLRVQEIRRLLQSSKPVTVNVIQKPEVRYSLANFMPLSILKT